MNNIQKKKIVKSIPCYSVQICNVKKKKKKKKKMISYEIK